MTQPNRPSLLSVGLATLVAGAVAVACTGRIETVLSSPADGGGGGGWGDDAALVDVGSSGSSGHDAEIIQHGDAAPDAPPPELCGLKPPTTCSAGTVCVGYEDTGIAGVGTCMKRCGAGTAVTCDPDGYCYQPGIKLACGDDPDNPSVCRAKWPFSGAPPVALLPACGCDGKTYNHEIFAAQAGVNLHYKGPCGVCSSDAECNRDVWVSSFKGACDRSVGTPGRCLCSAGASFDNGSGKCY